MVTSDHLQKPVAQADDSFESRLHRKLTTGSNSASPKDSTANSKGWQRASSVPGTQSQAMGTSDHLQKPVAQADDSFESRLHRKLATGSNSASPKDSTANAQSDEPEPKQDLEETDEAWTCLKCTFENDASSLNCAVCNEEKGKITRFSIMGIPHAFLDKL
jgi:hypothetical protein